MKFVELHARIQKIMRILIIQCQNTENHDFEWNSMPESRKS